MKLRNIQILIVTKQFKYFNFAYIFYFYGAFLRKKVLYVIKYIIEFYFKYCC